MFINASTGIVFNAAWHTQAADLLRDADIALYHAKSLGGQQYVFFDTEMHAQAIARLNLETDLRYALTRDELCVYYQPIIDLNTNCLHGFEALVRWQHPTKGLLSPGVFLPLAADIGLDIQIDRYVFRKACYQLREWAYKFPNIAPVISVNLSSRQLAYPDVVTAITHILLETKVDPRRIMIEITENSLIAYPDQAIDTLAQLRNLGIRIALDDFGTGYSSLSYLHRFSS